MSQTSLTPDPGTPSLAPNPNKSPSEAIFQLVPCGGQMYAVGKFGPILTHGPGSQTVQRNGVFSFSQTSPFDMSSFAPNVNGQVDTIAFVRGDCSEAYIGGIFTSVDGTPALDIAKVNTSTGAVDTSFKPNLGAHEVQTLLGFQGHLLVGGYFKGIYTSVSPSTGKSDGFVSNVTFSGNTPQSPPKIIGQALSPDGSRLLVWGDFTSVSGQSRTQIVMLDVSGSPASLTGWTSPAFFDACKATESDFVRGASWSPDGSKVFIATTGYQAISHPAGTNAGLCDATAAFTSQEVSQSPLWVNFFGCDSAYSSAANSTTVFSAGHFRRVDNLHGCNTLGPGAIPDPGLAGYHYDGTPYTTGSRGTYSMDRANASYMAVINGTLWIASDNRFDFSRCMGVSGHSGICALPVGP